MNKVTPAQLKKLHALLNNEGLLNDKADIILNLTDGRTSSSKEISTDEARKLISSLAEFDPNEKLRSLIFSLAYQAGIIYGDTPEDKKMNAAKLTLFLKERGAVKMALNDMHYKELVKVQRQFEAIVKNVKKANANKEADSAVKKLLTEFEGIHIF